MDSRKDKKIELGLKNNWAQFSLLVLINAFVGGMVGLERTILPAMAQESFGIAANTAILSFIVVFGLTKAAANYFMGKFANQIGRKRLLVIGWIFGVPVPFIIILASHWNWIVFANVLLGINQGLAWSATVIMKIDLVGPKNRGFAMGINEFAGYLAVGLVAFISGWMATTFGLRPVPFYLGIFFALLGLLGSIFFVRDTARHLESEKKTSFQGLLSNVFLSTSIKHPNLSSITQAGLVNNLNDGMVWGLFPIFLATKNYGLSQIGLIVAIYPIAWGIGQLFTGKLADMYPKKRLLFGGMLIQAIALIGFLSSFGIRLDIFLAIILGLGTAMVYPTFIAAIADNTHPTQRAESIGVFRLFRDLGYAIGALLTGWIADNFSLVTAVIFIAMITFCSALVIKFRMVST